jgi:hypothetical protein
MSDLKVIALQRGIKYRCRLAVVTALLTSASLLAAENP